MKKEIKEKIIEILHCFESPIDKEGEDIPCIFYRRDIDRVANQISELVDEQLKELESISERIKDSELKEFLEKWKEKQ